MFDSEGFGEEQPEVEALIGRDRAKICIRRLFAITAPVSGRQEGPRRDHFLQQADPGTEASVDLEFLNFVKKK